MLDFIMESKKIKGGKRMEEKIYKCRKCGKEIPVNGCQMR